MNRNSKERPKLDSSKRIQEQNESNRALDRSAKNVSVDLTPDQKAKLRELAVRSGMKVSEYLRAVIKDALAQEPQFEVQYRKIEMTVH